MKSVQSGWILALLCLAPVAQADVYIGPMGARQLRIGREAKGYRFQSCRDMGHDCNSLANTTFSREALQKGIDKLRGRLVADSELLASRRSRGVLTAEDQGLLAPLTSQILALDQVLRLLQDIQSQGYARVGYRPGEDVRYPTYLDTETLTGNLAEALAQLAPTKPVLQR